MSLRKYSIKAFFFLYEMFCDFFVQQCKALSKNVWQMSSNSGEWYNYMDYGYVLIRFIMVFKRLNNRFLFEVRDVYIDNGD